MYRAVAFMGFVVGSVACAAQPFRGPEQGGAEWIEARSKHFRLLTSQSENEAKEALEQLEVTQAIFEQIAFPSSENPPGVSEVVILPAAEFDALIGAGVISSSFSGYFDRHAGPRYAPLTRSVLRDDLGEQTTGLLQHELAHRFVAFHCPNAPAWFNEGLATFWQTLDVKRGTAYFGGALEVAVVPTPFDELVGLDDEAFYSGDETRVSQNYAAAAALARVLYFEHRDVLTGYVNALKSGQLSAAAAWEKAAGAELPAIKSDFDAFFSSHGVQGEIAAPVVSSDSSADPLPDAEVHLLWAGLWPRQPRYADNIRKEIAAALALDPKSTDAVLLRSSLSYELGQVDAARQDIEHALYIAPHRSNVLASALGFALESGQTLHLPVATLAARLAKYPPKASQLNLLASYFGKTGELERAIGLAGRAVQLDSSCVSCYVTGSELLAANGNLRAAVKARRAAIALAGERVEPSEQQRLRQLEQLLTQQPAVSP
jgi:tetratricopeptide (TPR) repeat protein